MLAFVLCACEVKIRHILDQTKPPSQRFIPYIALRCYSKLDGKMRTNVYVCERKIFIRLKRRSCDSLVSFMN